MAYDIDNASFGRCPECGDEILLHRVTEDDVLAKKEVLLKRGGTCDRCAEGSTPFEKQIRHQILQWLGPIEVRNHIATVVEPQNASYAVVTLKDGRSAKIFRYGESSRGLAEEVDHVLSHAFPDLKRVEKPGKK